MSLLGQRESRFSSGSNVIKDNSSRLDLYSHVLLSENGFRKALCRYLTWWQQGRADLSSLGATTTCLPVFCGQPLFRLCKKRILANTLRNMPQLKWCLCRMRPENCQKPFPQPFVELQTFVFHNLAVQIRLKNAIGRGKDSQFLVTRQTWYDAPGLYKARPRLVVVARRLRRYFAFASEGCQQSC